MTTEVASIFASLLEDIEGLDNVLKEVLGLENQEQIRLLFLRMREHEPQVHEFAELLSDHLVNYAIPLAKRMRANAQAAASPTGGSVVPASRLRREAIRSLITYSEQSRGRYGELGEIISYVIAVHFLRAAQVGAKMALKTSAEMPVHGVDGLHAKANEDGTVTFFLMESKLTPSAVSASREMMGSVSEYQSDRGRALNELRLVSDLSNLEALEGTQREVAKSYFNPYAGEGRHLKRRDIHVGSLVYSEAAYQNTIPRDGTKPISIHEDHFERLYASNLKNFLNALRRQAASRTVDLAGCIVFFVAVPDVNELKKLFAGLTK